VRAALDQLKANEAEKRRHCEEELDKLRASAPPAVTSDATPELADARAKLDKAKRDVDSKITELDAWAWPPIGRFAALKAANASRSFGVGSYDSSSLAEGRVADCLLFFGDFNVVSFPLDKVDPKFGRLAGARDHAPVTQANRIRAQGADPFALQLLNDTARLPIARYVEQLARAPLYRRGFGSPVVEETACVVDGSPPSRVRNLHRLLMVQAGESIGIGRRADLQNDCRALFDCVGFGVEGRRYGLTCCSSPFVNFVA
jgi:hypothetical protein